MNKKLLIITSTSEQTAAWREREAYIAEFCQRIEDRIEDLEIIFTTYGHLNFSVRGGQPAIYDNRNGLDVAKADLVHFKNWSYEAEEAALIAKYLDWKGIAYFNSEVGSNLAQGKINQMFILAHAGLPVPDTFYARKDGLKDIFENDNLPAGFKFPLIMKANHGSKGDDNYLIHSSAEALKILKKEKDSWWVEFVLQNLIPNSGDYRFLYIGLDEAPLVFKRTAAGGSHLNNTSKGGQGSFVDVAGLSKSMLALARKSAEVLRREIGGVDLIVDDKTGKIYVLEVNGTPALATGYGQEEKADRFADFVRRTLEITEEE